MNDLVAISIGPVQDFIAAARKCRDLWFGSYLLSELSKAAARELRIHGATLIIPAPESDRDLEPRSPFTVVNKLLAIVDKPDMAVFMEGVRTAIQTRLEAEAGIQSLRLGGATVDTALYWQQISGFAEFYCAWTPLTENYPSCRLRVEELLSARKTLRDFPFYQGQPGKFKSSLDGARESVVLKRSKHLFESNLKTNEHLDAIGVVKRFGNRKPRFDSTVDVAAMPYVNGCRNGSPARQAAFDAYCAFVASKDLSPQTYSLLYEHESRQLFDDLETEQELARLRKNLGSTPNPPYYALFRGDGDRMGQAVARRDTHQSHQALSAALSRFAVRARGAIDSDYEGCAIYCGGDDVLALLPIHKALAAAKHINQLFREELQLCGTPATFSAGLVVAHGLEPLNEVRAWASEAEKTAKVDGNRDSLCISVRPRSGVPLTAHGKWDEWLGPSEESAQTGLLPDLVSLTGTKEEEKGLPRSLGYELRELVERMQGWSEMDPILGSMVAALARKKKCSDAVRELLEKHTKDRPTVERLYRSMLIARWFARADREAAGDEATRLAA
jgi:CRISPR-associated protein Cmr2